MSTEQNKALFHRFFEELVNESNLALADKLIATDIMDHATPPGLPPNLEGFKQFLGSFLTAFPDIHVKIEDVIAEGDKVVARVTVHGTHKGTFMGIPPTGKQATWTAIHIARVTDGKMAERWITIDLWDIIQQLGVVPLMPQHSG